MLADSASPSSRRAPAEVAGGESRSTPAYMAPEQVTGYSSCLPTTATAANHAYEMCRTANLFDGESLRRGSVP